jgi:phospholipid transport system substrate-binding protein
MLTRRTLLRSSLALAALAADSPAWPARALSPGQAAQFIDQAAKQMIAVIDAAGSEAQKRPQLQQIIDRVVAVEEIGRFCLGRFWRTASPQQQQEYLRLFHRVLLNSITGHLGDYKGITYTLGRPVPGEGGVQVPSVMNRPGQPAANLTWVVADVGGSPKIIDVIAEGTSMRLTQRSDYNSFLNRNGGNVQALIDAMKRQAGQSG